MTATITRAPARAGERQLLAELVRTARQDGWEPTECWREWGSYPRWTLSWDADVDADGRRVVILTDHGSCRGAVSTRLLVGSVQQLADLLAALTGVGQHLTTGGRAAARAERAAGFLAAVVAQLDARLEAATTDPAGLAGASDADRIAQAIGDPGSVVGRRRGPDWLVDDPAYREDWETVTRWSTRAVLHVLTGADGAATTDPAGLAGPAGTTREPESLHSRAVGQERAGTVPARSAPAGDRS